MATDAVGSVGPPFITPPSAEGRWQGNFEMYAAPVRQMSGNLPDEPADMPTQAVPNTPWKDLRDR